MIECEHGDDASTCPPCRRAAGKDRPPPARRITARYDGACPACGGDVWVGQVLVDTPRGWVHDLCHQP